MRLDLLHHLVGALERRRVRQQRVHQDVALILLGHEAGRDPLHEHDDHVAEDADERQAAEHLARQNAGQADVAVGRPAEHPVEAVVERREQRLLAASPASAACAASAGLSVSALTTDSSTDIAIVIANCW